MCATRVLTRACISVGEGRSEAGRAVFLHQDAFESQDHRVRELMQTSAHLAPPLAFADCATLCAGAILVRSVSAPATRSAAHAHARSEPGYRFILVTPCDRK